MLMTEEDEALYRKKIIDGRSETGVSKLQGYDSRAPSEAFVSPRI